MRGDGLLESAEAAATLDKLDAGLLTREQVKDQSQWIALRAGIKWGLMTAAVTVPATWMAVKHVAAVSSNLGTSGRVATAFIPPLFAFTFSAEMTASRLANPQAFERFKSRERESLPLHRRLKRVVDENPTAVLVAVGLPVVGAIFYKNSQAQHLTLSQKVMHTRVIGQGTVLAILASLAAYHFFDEVYGGDGDGEEHHKHR
jgi:hypothetical protein